MLRVRQSRSDTGEKVLVEVNPRPAGVHVVPEMQVLTTALSLGTNNITFMKTADFIWMMKTFCIYSLE